MVTQYTHLAKLFLQVSYFNRIHPVWTGIESRTETQWSSRRVDLWYFADTSLSKSAALQEHLKRQMSLPSEYTQIDH